MPVFKRFYRESYSEPVAVYELLKKRGMDLVTVTDHDSIESSERLRQYPDFFVSEEVTCSMPSGTEVHIGVYDLNDRQHVEIQDRRNDLPRLLAYLQEQELLFSLNHPFSAVTGRRKSMDIGWFRYAFPAVEVRNGQMLSSSNELAEEFVRAGNQVRLGGSDSHTMFSVGHTFTEVPEARNLNDFMQGLRMRRSLVAGQNGNYWKLTRDVLWIACEAAVETPVASLLLPLLPLIPLAMLVNYLREFRFARRWRACVQDGLDTTSRISRPNVPLRPEGVAT